MYRIKTADQGLNFLLIGLQCTTGRWKPRANQLDPSTRFDILTCDRHRQTRGYIAVNFASPAVAVV